MEWADERISEKGLRKEFIEDYFYKKRNNLSKSTDLLCEEEDQDISFLLQYTGGTLINNCYKVILDREADEEGYFNFCECLDNGMPKKAIIYAFMNSQEVDSTKKFKQKEEYGYIFENYQKMVQSKKSRLKRAIKKVLNKIFTRNSHIRKMILDSERKRDLRDAYYKERIAELEQGNDSMMKYIQTVETKLEDTNSLIKELLCEIEQNNSKF